MTQLLTICGSLNARSANRALLDAVAALARDAGHVVDDFGGVREIPPFDPDRVDDPGAAVRALRHAIASADAVVIAAPEYAGSLAGAAKNALDWIVGSGEFYGKAVGVASTGTTGGEFARAVLAQTLTWQGALVVADLGIDAPRTKSDAAGAFTDPPTLAAIAAFTRTVLEARAE